MDAHARTWSRIQAHARTWWRTQAHARLRRLHVDYGSGRPALNAGICPAFQRRIATGAAPCQSSPGFKANQNKSNGLRLRSVLKE